MPENETHEEEGFYIEYSENYSTDPETDTEPVIHISSEIIMSNSDEVSTHELLRLSLLDNKIIWSDSEKVVDENHLKEYNDFLKSPYENDPSITNWEYLCNDWKKYHDIEFPKEQPDYTKIKKG